MQKQNTWERYDWLGRQIQAQNGGLDVRQALQLLVNKPVGNPAMLHSCVFDPSKRAAYVAIAGSNPPVTAGKRAYTRVDFTPWFE